MTETVAVSHDEVVDLSIRALVNSGCSEASALSLALGIAAAERDGIASHGLAYLPTYCEHLICGKVLPDALPVVEEDEAVVRVDGGHGFAHPAIDAGFTALIPRSRRHGIGTLAVRRSYNCGVLSYHTERLANAGLVGIGFTNAPASIAGWQGRGALLGTNPWSLAVPDGSGNAAILIDQSASVVAKSEVMKHAREGSTIPEGWALDADGMPTTDPEAGLAGTMMPAGGHKGVGSALFVEVMASCLTGALLGIDASPFSGTNGGPPGTGQFFIAIDPVRTAGDAYSTRLARLVQVFAESDGARLPGERRFANRARSHTHSIEIAATTYERAQALAQP